MLMSFVSVPVLVDENLKEDEMSLRTMDGSELASYALPKPTSRDVFKVVQSSMLQSTQPAQIFLGRENEQAYQEQKIAEINALAVGLILEESGRLEGLRIVPTLWLLEIQLAAKATVLEMKTSGTVERFIKEQFPVWRRQVFVGWAHPTIAETPCTLELIGNHILTRVCADADILRHQLELFGVADTEMPYSPESANRLVRLNPIPLPFLREQGFSMRRAHS